LLPHSAHNCTTLLHNFLHSTRIAQSFVHFFLNCTESKRLLFIPCTILLGFLFILHHNFCTQWLVPNVGSYHRFGSDKPPWHLLPHSAIITQPSLSFSLCYIHNCTILSMFFFSLLIIAQLFYTILFIPTKSHGIAQSFVHCMLGNLSILRCNSLISAQNVLFQMWAFTTGLDQIATLALVATFHYNHKTFLVFYP
jgi:hypothetical protein